MHVSLQRLAAFRDKGWVHRAKVLLWREFGQLGVGQGVAENLMKGPELSITARHSPCTRPRPNSDTKGRVAAMAILTRLCLIDGDCDGGGEPQQVAAATHATCCSPAKERGSRWWHARLPTATCTRWPITDAASRRCLCHTPHPLLHGHRTSTSTATSSTTAPQGPQVSPPASDGLQGLVAAVWAASLHGTAALVAGAGVGA